jgi:hypothetical protein
MKHASIAGTVVLAIALAAGGALHGCATAPSDSEVAARASSSPTIRRIRPAPIATHATR